MSRAADPVPLQEGEPDLSQSGIVSVNSRGGSGGNVLGKVFFTTGVVGLLVVAGFYGYNKHQTAKAVQAAATKQVSKEESRPAQAGLVRNFDQEQAAADVAAYSTSQPNSAGTGDRCGDGAPGMVALGPDNRPLLSPSGVPMRVCNDGHIIVPNIDTAAAPVFSPDTQAGAKPSRYGGDALIAGAGHSGELTSQLLGSNQTDAAGQVAALLQQVQHGAAGLPPGGATLPGGLLQQGGGLPGAPAPSPPGSIGEQLTPSDTPLVKAAMLGDLNMILPKGRSIDCGLSMRMISDLAGFASCILSQNIYSDNGKVLLLERGSEAFGEYKPSGGQGLERIFVLWTRIKTPSGVIINLNSPGSDELGTTGLAGAVNNHWWKRLGAAVLLSIVEDAIAYKTAQSTNSGGAGGVAVYQNVSQTGNDLASKVLESTINIKPTIYKNQGDRSSIYVARDLDFGSVYALRPR
jgi:type IV secretion system protein VirB10